MSSVPTEQLRAMIRLLWPDEITPIAKRQLELLCDAADVKARYEKAVDNLTDGEVSAIFAGSDTKNE